MPIYYVALGDSLTVGTGSLMAPSFVDLYKKQLEQFFHEQVHVEKIAKNGLLSLELKRIVETPEIMNLIAHANIITITIGGNDLRRIWKRYERNPSPSELYSSLEAVLQNIWEIVDHINTIKKNVPRSYSIRLMTLYNPIPHPHATEAIRYFNQQLMAFTSYSIKVADVYHYFLGRENELLFIDRFHPNKRGYRIIANAFHHIGYEEILVK